MRTDNRGQILPDDLVQLEDDLIEPDEEGCVAVSEEQLGAILEIDWWQAILDGLESGIFVKYSDLFDIGIEDCTDTPLDCGLSPMTFWTFVDDESKFWDEEDGWHTGE